MRWTIGAGILAAAAMAGGCLQVMGWEEARPGWKGDGGAAGGGSGGAGSCQAGETKSCYGGPAGTEGVGICKAGTAICKADGSGFGACEGEVGPAPWRCLKAEDDGCTGSVCGQTVWVSHLPNVQTTGIAADPSTGAVYVSGTFTGTATVGGETFTSPPAESDMLVAKLEADGQVAWAKQDTSAIITKSGAIAFGHEAVTVIGGGKVDAWGQLLGGFYVTRYDAKGALQWTSTCKSAGGNADVAMDPTNGDGIVGGSYYYVECGDTTAGASVDSDVFVSRLAAADGSGVRTALFKSSFNAYARTLATDAEGNALIGGRVDTGLEVGTTQIHDQDMFVAKLASNGFVLWAKDLGIGHVLALATDARGDIAVLANCRPLEPPTYALAAFADPGLCVAKLSGADGTLLWARSFGVASTGENQDFGHTIAVSSNGDVAIAGTAQNLILDGQQVTEAGFVTVLEGTSGLARWVGSFDFSKPKISFSKQDMLAVAANFGPGTVDFGTGALTTKSGETDSVVFLIAP